MSREDKRKTVEKEGVGWSGQKNVTNYGFMYVRERDRKFM